MDIILPSSVMQPGTILLSSTIFIFVCTLPIITNTDYIHSNTLKRNDVTAAEYTYLFQHSSQQFNMLHKSKPIKTPGRDIP